MKKISKYAIPWKFSEKLILNLHSGNVKQTKCGAAYVFKYLTAVALKAVDGFSSANVLISCK